jgi:hypothetical protein
MGFLRRILGGDTGRREDTGDRDGTAADGGLPLGGGPTEFGGADQHAVTVWIRLSDAELTSEREALRVFALEDRVMAAIDTDGVGTYDTNDLERGFFRMHAYGPDAERLAAVIAPIVAGAPAGSYIAVRAGAAGTSEERRELG